jgi:hypothetical protein
MAAASAALGVALSEPANLGGSERSAVLRCREPDGTTVVVKSYPRTSAGAESFTAEAAGLAFTSEFATGPRLLPGPGQLHPSAPGQRRHLAAGLRRAMAAWTLHAMTYLLDLSVIADRPMTGDRRAAPTARQLLRYRWQRLLAELKPAGELSSICALAGHLLATTEDWLVAGLPLYPAFS